MRLIDADELKTKAIKCETFKLTDTPVFFKAVGTKEIDKAPTVDAVEVVRKPVADYEGKQMPKKPAKQWGDNVCPNCRTDTRCRVLMGWEEHCPDCGQAIDWSDAE